MRKIFLFLIILLAISVAYAIPFDVKYAPIADSIYTNETAKYTITIETDFDYSGRFQFYTISANWDISPTLATYNGTKKEWTLEIVPLDNTLTGPNLVPVTFKSLDDDRLKIENLFIYLKSYNETPKEYTPNVIMEVKIDSEIDPRELATVTVHMRNRNPLDLKDIRIIVNSELFNKEYLTTLGPLEEKENSMLFGNINPMLEPKKYTVNVQLIDSLNRTIASSSKEVMVKSYADIFMEQTRQKRPFMTKEVFELHNKGNDYTTKKVKVQKNLFERIFTVTSEKARTENIDGKTHLTWDVQLKPGEKRSLIITTNYMPLIIIILLIIIFTIIYYVFRSPILLFKRAKIVASSDHGLSEIKVRLHVKNRTGKTLRNIRIIDKYPKIVQLEEESALGMLKPSRMISADKTHSLLMWNLEVLDPYEERLLTYKLKSQLNIVGNMRLPPSKVKFLTHAGERTYFSNDVVLLHKSAHHIKNE